MRKSSGMRTNLVTLAVLVMLGGFGAAAAEETGAHGELCQYGVTLALSGDLDKAEEAFVSLLSEAPGDPRAYLNLGNIQFLRGELGVAMVFYDKALSADSEDPGIHLNRATTLLIMGDDEAARAEAAICVEKAGSPAAAAALAGLEKGMEGEGSDKASDKTFINTAEVKDLLQTSGEKSTGAMGAGMAEADSLGAEGGTPLKKRHRLWRSAAPRASDVSESALVLYWKQ